MTFDLKVLDSANINNDPHKSPKSQTETLISESPVTPVQKADHFAKVPDDHVSIP